MDGGHDANLPEAMVPEPRPLILAYVCPAGSREDQLRWATRLTAWATAEGWTMVDVFSDPNPAVPVERRPGLVALVEELKRKEAAVVVPSRDDLPGDETYWPELRETLASTARAVHVLPESDIG